VPRRAKPRIGCRAAGDERNTLGQQRVSSLNDVLLADEVRRLHRAGRSGVLTVRTEGVTKALFLQSGRLVFASSTSDEDKLGEQLIRLGRISRAEFVAAFAQVAAGRKRLGEVLVGTGALAEEEVGGLVARQVQRIVLSLFTWTNGEMGFRAIANPAPPDLAVDLSTDRLLFEGARLYRDVGRLERALGNPGQRLHCVTPPPFDMVRVTLTPVERAVLDHARAGLRVADVLSEVEPRPLTVCALYAAIAGGLIETGEMPTSQPAVEPEIAGFRVATVSAPLPGAEDPTDRILRVFETLPRASHYEILELKLDATSQDVEAAYRRLSEQDQQDSRSMVGDVRLDSALDAIRARRREAYETLRDGKRREAYDRSLSGHGETSRQGAATAESHADALRLGREASGLLQRGERDAAVSLLLRAVDADPQERSVRRQLAVALADHPKLWQQAERHFRVALDLDPRDIDLRCRLARYHRRAGMLARARLQVEAALRLDPESGPALAELEAIEAHERQKR
jgi:tetratricopeptide (TPR) repeat protein